MDEEIIVPEEAVPYILYQRTAYLSASRSWWYRISKKILPGLSYKLLVSIESKSRSNEVKRLFSQDMKEDYERIQPALPQPCGNILDIGCGVAGIDVFLFRHYQCDPSLKFYLLDKTSVTPRIYYGFKNQGAFYNSLRIAGELLRENGIPRENIDLIEVAPDLRIDIDGKMDLIISLISWGHHYPVSTYLNQVYDLLRPAGHLILDVRKGTDGRKELEKKFSTVEIIYEFKKCDRVLAIK